MGRFLREYWLWILIPFLIVTAVVVYVMVGGGTDESTTPFSYPIY